MMALWGGLWCLATPGLARFAEPATDAVPGLLAPPPTGRPLKHPPLAPTLSPTCPISLYSTVASDVLSIRLVTRSRSRMSLQRHCTCRYLLIFVMPVDGATQRNLECQLSRYRYRIPPAQWVNTL